MRGLFLTLNLIVGSLSFAAQAELPAYGAIPTPRPEYSPTYNIVPTPRPEHIPAYNIVPTSRPEYFPVANVVPTSRPEYTPASNVVPTPRPEYFPASNVVPTPRPLRVQESILCLKSEGPIRKVRLARLAAESSGRPGSLAVQLEGAGPIDDSGMLSGVIVGLGYKTTMSNSVIFETSTSMRQPGVPESIVISWKDAALESVQLTIAGATNADKISVNFSADECPHLATLSPPSQN